MSTQEKLRLLRKSLGEPRIEKKAKGEYVFLCPICRHPKPKLSVNVERDEFNCWTCDAEKNTRGKTLTRLLRIGCTPEEVESYVRTLPSDGRPRPTRVVASAPPTLPKEYEPACELRERDVLARQFTRYLRSRGVDESLMVLYRVGVCRSGRFSNRVVFPSFDEDGELDFFTCRTVDPDCKFSYMTCDSSKDIVSNSWLVDWRFPVTIVEGPFDAIAAGTNAVPLHGKMLLDRLFSTLTERCSRVYVALDNDARKQQLEIARRLFRYQLEVMLVDLPGKDPSELGSRAFDAARDRARPFNEFSRMRGLVA